MLTACKKKTKTLAHYENLSASSASAYLNNPKYWDRNAWENNVDPDQMLHSAASDLGLHCLPFIQQLFQYIDK